MSRLLDESDPATPLSPLVTFLSSHFGPLAVLVLTLTAFNLTFRLGSESVVEWDESLYATSALEMVQHGNWVATTFDGQLDYYNTKPPLNIWMIALAFKALGLGVVTLRLSSVLSAWAAVAILMVWARRAIGPATAIVAGVVLSTTFAFIYVHAGRTAETDSLFALLVLLTVVVTWAAADRPWRLGWLGPLAATAFLLRGMAVLMPLAIVAIVEIGRRRPLRDLWRPAVAAVAIAVAIAGPWSVLRWNLDDGRFFRLLVGMDFLARSTDVLDGHAGGPLFYMNILQKHHYDWLLAAAVACLLFPLSRARLRENVRVWRHTDDTVLVIGAWVLVTLLVPTVMQTKLPWYLNPFYPAFALLVAWVCVRGLACGDATAVGRHRALAAVMVAVFVIAEAKLLWYSFHHRDLHLTAQGMLLAERGRLHGRRIYRERWNAADAFVVRALLAGDPQVAANAETFLTQGTAADYLLAPPDLAARDIVMVSSDGIRAIYRKK